MICFDLNAFLTVRFAFLFNIQIVNWRSWKREDKWYDGCDGTRTARKSVACIVLSAKACMDVPLLSAYIHEQ